MTTKQRVTRRALLKSGATIAAAAGAALDPATAFGQAPAVVTARTFRAWVSRGTGRNRTTLQELRLRPVTGRQVVVRTEATNLCYSNAGLVLGLQDPPPATGNTAGSLAGGTAAPVLLVTGSPYAPGLDAVTGDLLWQAGVREVRVRETVGASDGILHFLRFLREAASQGVDVAWESAGDLGCDTRLLYHLPPPAGHPSWRSAYRYGLCHYRVGPGFVTVADRPLLNIGAAFWGLVCGLVISWLMERADFAAKRAS